MAEDSLKLGEAGEGNQTRASNYAETTSSSGAQKDLKKVIKEHNLQSGDVLFYLKSPFGWHNHHGTPYGGRFYRDPDGYYNSGLQADYLTSLMSNNLIDEIESGRVKRFLKEAKRTLLYFYVVSFQLVLHFN